MRPYGDDDEEVIGDYAAPFHASRYDARKESS